MFGLGLPPHCELCPSRFGAFKRADVGGGWVHLLCALYTHGISFADVDRLTGVSWQEIDYKAFGRRACNGCSDPLEARTGIATQCEAGLCRHYYHIACAQRLGLLSDLSDTGNINGLHGMHPHPNFLLCKKHNNSDAMKARRDGCAAFLRQEDRRMADYRLLCRLTQRQELKR
jgi:PHD-zinc-finger like domain